MYAGSSGCIFINLQKIVRASHGTMQQSKSSKEPQKISEGVFNHFNNNTKLEQGEDEDDMVMITNEEEEEVVVEEEEETRKRKRLEKVDVDDNVSRWNSFLVLEHVDHRRRNPSHFCFFLGQPIFSPHYRVLFTEFVHRSSFLSIYLVLPSI